MSAHQRHQKITEILERQRTISVFDLQVALRASSATVRRDLHQLEQAGRVVRTHGGVLHPEFFSGEPPFARKAREAVAAKAALAERAAQRVPAHATLFIDAGSTTLELGRRLLQRDDLTLFTNSLPLLQERPSGRARLMALAGELREVSRALVGELAIEWLRHLHFDLAFLGASGISLAEGVCTTEPAEAAVKRQAIACAERAIVLVDAAKWRGAAPVVFGRWGEVHEIITDHPARPDEIAHLRQRGTALHVLT